MPPLNLAINPAALTFLSFQGIWRVCVEVEGVPLNAGRNQDREMHPHSSTPSASNYG